MNDGNDIRNPKMFGGFERQMEDGNPFPPEIPPRGTPVPPEIRKYAHEARQRIFEDPLLVPATLHAWLNVYEHWHTQANTPKSRRRAAFFEEETEEGNVPAPETERAAGERPDNILKAGAALTEVFSKREEQVLAKVSAAYTMGARDAQNTIKIQNEGLMAMSKAQGESLTAMSGVLVAALSNDKEKLADHLSLIGILKKATNGEAIPSGFDWGPVLAAAGPLVQTIGIPLLQKVLSSYGLQLTEQGAVSIPAQQTPQAPQIPASTQPLIRHLGKVQTTTQPSQRRPRLIDKKATPAHAQLGQREELKATDPTENPR